MSKIKKEYTVLDLFSGAGGLSEGFRQAGMKIIGGIDVNKDAIDTFNHNFRGATGINADLSKIHYDQILNEYKEFHNIDIIIGGPPCQGFSVANRYRTEEEDPRNQLFYEFLKFVDVIIPKVVVIENVRGIITSNNGKAKDRIYELFESRNYKVNHKILDASEYGVPQKRIRNFFIITKNEKFDFDLIEKETGTTVLDAIGELYSLENNRNTTMHLIEEGPASEYRDYLRRIDNHIENHLIVYPADFVQERISFVPQGGNWRDVPENLWPSNRSNRHSSAYKRLDEEDFSVTIDTGNTHSNYFHPIYNRIPTVREAARLQSFPDDFVFCGSRTKQYIQVGNAVPPRLAYYIADAVRRHLDE